MPAKNSIKEYLENGCYHIYNRGVEKRLIFLDRQDFAVFLNYLKDYLSFKDTNKLHQITGSNDVSYEERQKAGKMLALNNFYSEIDLLAFVLMPNHYHFLIKQINERSIDKFINSLGTRYTMYFNRKYKRVGKLYQGVYKAVRIDSDEQLLQVSRYIHLNPGENSLLPSSLANYLGEKTTSWIKTDQILNYFSKSNPRNTYSSFMSDSIDAEFISSLSLDINDE